jgi:aspartyl-tRNA synthetase
LKLDLLGDRQRTHYCGELRQLHAGQPVFLAGWVARRRDLGNLIFLDLRDHTGVTQIVCNPAVSAEAHDRADEVRPEYVVGVEGEVVVRAPETVNAQILTGEVEVMARKLLVLNEAKTPPFPIEDETKISEEVRLRYRYLDLRRGRMQRHLRLRHRASLAVREHMSAHGFVEIETPFLTRSTPEGARDYLVPSRIHHGRFYALPQSPQLFKQILMIAGYDRYFQIVRCFRDEDLRADRQPEFTQVDIEMAFPQRAVLFDIVEQLMEKLFALVDVKVARPFSLLSYDTVMERYGSDKPHLGFELAWKMGGLPSGADIKLDLNPEIKLLTVPARASTSRSQIDKLRNIAQETPGMWFSHIKVGNSDVQSSLVKTIGVGSTQELAKAAEAAPGDLVLVLGIKKLSADKQGFHRLHETSGRIRMELARSFDLIKPATWNFLWVVDFPMFEFDEKLNRYVSMHHPFTSPAEQYLHDPFLEMAASSIKAQAYDLVLNGVEIAGGSFRIHRKDIQERVFKILGLTEEKARERFGFFLDALECGTPPHGGIALGYDRIIALMAGESNIREVIAFPKTASAVDLMCDAPATVDPEQLEELGLEIKTQSRVKSRKPDSQL